MDKESLKDLLRRYNLKPNFTYGQNFLVDEMVLKKIVEVSNLSSADLVVEIGPGIGNLTKELCKKAKLVLSIEKDPKFEPLLNSLKNDFPKNFIYKITDALKCDFQKVLSENNFSEINYKVVANIPYYITGKILEMFLTAKHKPSSITVLTQKEVAERVVAQKGELSLLAISVQIFGEPKFIQVVPKESFFPAPKVDSAILHIDLFKSKKFNITNEKKFFKILKACFSGKRKQIHNTLVNNLRLDKNLILAILSELKINPMARPQELSIEEWVSLNNKISI